MSCEKYLSRVVELLAEEGLLSLKELYVDGTKLEANANKYTFVWGNSIKTNKDKMKKQLDGTLALCAKCGRRRDGQS